MTTFKNFIDSRPARSANKWGTQRWGTQRAEPQDVAAALDLVAAACGWSRHQLSDRVLGSAARCLNGERADCGDIDLAVDRNLADPLAVHALMMQAVDGRGELNTGTRVGSYAVELSDKRVQVDLMFVSSVPWARFIYWSPSPLKSAYSGAVRNILMMTALTFIEHPDQDFTKTDAQGRTLARARRSIRMDSGLLRLFKLARIRRDGSPGALETVTPSALQQWVDLHCPTVKFSHNQDLISEPAAVVQFIFGPDCTQSAVQSAEGVIAQIKKMPQAQEILERCRSELERLALPVPAQLLT